MRKTTKKLDALFDRIAWARMGIKTLETQRSDSLDFHDVAVWTMRAALHDAYEAGLRAGIEDAKKAAR